MTDAERARALSGATRGCLWVPTDIPAKEYERRAANLPHDAFCQGKCQGSGRVFILDERARRQCPSSDHYAADPTVALACPCGGSGWLTTLVIPEPEPCFEPIPDGAVWGVSAESGSYYPIHPPTHRCGGSGTVTHPDTDRIIAVLEAAGCNVSYDVCDELPSTHRTCWGLCPQDGFFFHDPNLLVAACQALGVEGTP